MSKKRNYENKQKLWQLSKVTEGGLSPNQIRANTYATLMDDFYNLWLSSRIWTGLEREQWETVMRLLWNEGRVAAFRILEPIEGSEGLLGFCKFAPIAYNYLMYPTRVNLVPIRRTQESGEDPKRYYDVVPHDIQVVGKDAALGYAIRSKTPVKNRIKPFVERIAEVDVAINMNLNAHKMPLLYEVQEGANGSKAKVEDLAARMMNGDPNIFVGVGMAGAVKSVSGSIPYIIDKLVAYREWLVDQIKGVMGIDNVGTANKKEHLLVDEVNAGNQGTNIEREIVTERLREFCDDINRVFGVSVGVEDRFKPVESIHDDGEDNEPAEEGEEEREE